MRKTVEIKRKWAYQRHTHFVIVTKVKYNFNRKTFDSSI